VVFHTTSSFGSNDIAEQEGHLRSSCSHSAETLLEVARDPSIIGAEIASSVFCILESEARTFIRMYLRAARGGPNLSGYAQSDLDKVALL